MMLVIHRALQELASVFSCFSLIGDVSMGVCVRDLQGKAVL